MGLAGWLSCILACRLGCLLLSETASTERKEHQQQYTDLCDDHNSFHTPWSPLYGVSNGIIVFSAPLLKNAKLIPLENSLYWWLFHQYSITQLHTYSYRGLRYPFTFPYIRGISTNIGVLNSVDHL